MKKDEINYKYLTDPEFSIKADLKAIEISKKIDVENIGIELALFGQCLLNYIDEEVVLIDPLKYEIVINKKGKEDINVT